MTMLLEAVELTKHFPVRRGVFGKAHGAVRAVDGISFTVEKGRTLGVVGESGCGKTTTAKLVLGLEEPTSGTLRVNGNDITALTGSARAAYRRSVQAVFQDPFASLNPRMRVGQIIMEPLITHEKVGGPELKKRLERLLDLVGLPARAADLFPHEFSPTRATQSCEMPTARRRCTTYCESTDASRCPSIPRGCSPFPGPRTFTSICSTTTAT
jgi:ABC-type oligopeptide transport system ATPase subunit